MDSTNRLHGEERRLRNEDGHSISCTRTEEEKRRRQEWLRQQERERQHEKLKQQKIKEYERKREQALKLAQRKSSRHSRSRSNSKSPTRHHYKGRSTSNASKPGTSYEKLDGSSSGAVPLFKGPEGLQINGTELQRIKVDIRRNIPAKGPVSELQRDIVNPEDVILQRREGEGCKPIFDREEIKTVTVRTNVEDRRTVVFVGGEQSASTSKLRTSRNRSLSSSPIRKRGYSPGFLSSSRYRRSSSERRREHKERYTERYTNKSDTNHSRSRLCSPLRSSSRSRLLSSRERDPCTSNSRSFMENRTYRDRSRRERSSEERDRRERDRRERSRERRDRDRRERSRERRDRDRSRSRFREPINVIPHMIPVPNHSGFFLRPPFATNPMVPLRGQVFPVGRGRHPGLMAPIRPFPPGIIPPNVYRFGPPPYLNIYNGKIVHNKYG